MKLIQYSLVVLTASIIMCSCSNNRDKGASTPIDSTNVYGTAPATYDGDNPAQMPDTNINDTGTKANNIHNTGHDNPEHVPGKTN